MKYEEYKDRSHWEVCAFKRKITINNGKDYKDFLDNEIYPVMGSGGCFAYCSKFMYDGEALLMGRKGTIDKPLYIKGKFWVVDTMFYAVPTKDLYCKFAYYLALTFPYSLYSTSTALPSMTQTDIGNNPVAFPLFSEQRAIAAYLDKNCGEINPAIYVQKKKIDLLNELKQTIITDAVTKGLDPNAPMKDSGVEWIGEIPAHWDVMKLKYSFKNLDYMREPISAEKRERINPIYDYYGASGVIDKIDNYNVDDTVLLIGEDGANLVMRNLPLIYKATGKFWVNNHAHILKPQKGNSYDYMAYLLEMVDYTTSITGSAQPKLSQENLGHILLCVPPFSEQQTIASHLDEECAKIDLQISKANRRIELLNELKQSIITEAVTGKIKVC